MKALKKIQIYRTPEYLIVHLKRFSHRAGTFFGGSRKISMHIDFPMKSLNMTPYLVEVQNQLRAGASETKQYIYDLYAVSNHYGSMNGGHYTAYC